MPLIASPKLNAAALRAKALLLHPKDEWQKIASEPGGISDVLMDYALILAAIPASAGFLGKMLFGYNVLGVVYRPPFFAALTSAVFSYAGNILGVFIAGFVVDFLAPKFGGARNQVNAFKLAVYGATAFWVAGILLLFPALSMIAMLCGLYSIFLFYLGFPVLMKTPQDQAIPGTVVSLAVTVVLSALIGFAITAFAPGGAYPGMTIVPH